MLQTELSKPDLSHYAQVHWLEDVKAVRIQWLDLFVGLDDFKQITTNALELIKEHKSSIWIMDAFNSDGVFSNEIQSFISDELVELGVSEGVLKVLTIMPKSAGLANMTTKNWQARVRKKNAFVMEDFSDLDACKKWILS